MDSRLRRNDGGSGMTEACTRTPETCTRIPEACTRISEACARIAEVFARITEVGARVAVRLAPINRSLAKFYEAFI
ncbi:MAG: hypothetical protein COB51_04795 [Moraxellaceae bacterium]|nr:MAG: hypothetical protein COB51_04795 [Moraxellaceae bacterium]